jgi:starvation-inducible outer membrane lipoprotein
MKLPQLLQSLMNSTGAVDIFIGNLMTVGFLIWNTIEGSVFENEYPYSFVKLYTIPLWRLLILVLMITAASWNHSLGIMIAFTLFFYVMDMEVTMDKWK